MHIKHDFIQIFSKISCILCYFMQSRHVKEICEKGSKERGVDHFLKCFCKPQEGIQELEHIHTCVCVCQLLIFLKPFDRSRGHEGSHMCVYHLVHDFQKLFQLFGSSESHTPFHIAMCPARWPHMGSQENNTRAPT